MIVSSENDVIEKALHVCILVVYSAFNDDIRTTVSSRGIVYKMRLVEMFLLHLLLLSMSEA